jgi:hypothetical protein
MKDSLIIFPGYRISISLEYFIGNGIDGVHIFDEYVLPCVEFANGLSGARRVDLLDADPTEQTTSNSWASPRPVTRPDSVSIELGRDGESGFKSGLPKR